jgi:membrane-associated phospholipid phosphatase
MASTPFGMIMRRALVSLTAATLAAACLVPGASAQTTAPMPRAGASPQPRDSIAARPQDAAANDAGTVTMPDPVAAARPHAGGSGEGELSAAGQASGPVRVRLGRPAAAALPVPAFKDLFTGLDDDLGRLASRQSAFVLGVGAGLALAAHAEDRDVTAILHGSALARRTAPPGTVIGNGATQLAIAFGTYALGRASGHPRAASLGADLVRAQLLTQAITYGLKTATHRTRPDGSAQAFPSGHASATFATATVLQRHFGWKVGVPAYALASYVAASRLASNRHYPSDVVFGAALGTLVGRSVTIGAGRTRLAVEPLAVPGGAGIAFTPVR